MIVSQSPPRWLNWATAALGVLGFVYLAAGCHDLVTDQTFLGTFQHIKALVTGSQGVTPQTNPQHAMDVKMRWKEQAYIRMGINPYDIAFHPEKADPKIGRIPGVDSGGYPPWAFLTQEVLALPLPLGVVRWYLALVNALAYFAIASWAYGMGRQIGGKEVGWFMVAMCLACAGNAIQLRWGNYAAIVMALLVGMNFFSKRRQPVLAGLFLGWAMLKPQNAMLFTFVLMARKQWSGVAVAIGYTLVAGCITAWRVGTNPLHMVDQLFQGAMTWSNLHLGILDPIMASGLVPIPVLTKIGLLSGIIIAAGLIWHYRSRSNEVLMAIAAVTSYVSTYHRRFDAMMLAFLLVPLAVRAFRSNSALVWAALIINGLFLWLPLRESDYYNLVTSTVHCFAAIWGLAVLLRDPDANLAESDDRRAANPLLSTAM